MIRSTIHVIFLDLPLMGIPALVLGSTEAGADPALVYWLEISLPTIRREIALPPLGAMGGPRASWMLHVLSSLMRRYDLLQKKGSSRPSHG